MATYKFLLSIVSRCAGDVMNIRPTYVSLKVTNGDRNVILDSSLDQTCTTMILLPCPIFHSHTQQLTHTYTVSKYSLFLRCSIFVTQYSSTALCIKYPFYLCSSSHAAFCYYGIIKRKPLDYAANYAMK